MIRTLHCYLRVGASSWTRGMRGLWTLGVPGQVSSNQLDPRILLPKNLGMESHEGIQI